MTEVNKRVLVVDDDPHIREVIRFALEKAGMSVVEASNGEEGLRQAKSARPDLVVLDILMPEMDGLTMCRELRKHTDDLPILFLSSRDDEVDRILGLEMGGDDYMTKPFSPRELVARVNVIFKWLGRYGDRSLLAPLALRQGAIELNPVSYTVNWNDRPLILTATEFALLERFLRNPNRVYSRDDLIDSDVFRDIISDRTVDSHIRRLRQKAAEAGCQTLIDTVHGVGYRLGACQ